MAKKLTLTGEIVELFDEQQITEKFRKREFVLDTGDDNPILFQTTNQNIQELEGHKVGDQVEVAFYLNGRRWEKNGKVNWFCNNNAVEIARH